MGRFIDDVLRRDRRHEPAVVDLLALAGADQVAHLVVDHLLERRVVLAHHDGQRLDREELADHLELRRIRPTRRSGRTAARRPSRSRRPVLSASIFIALALSVHRADVDAHQAVAVGLVDRLERRRAGGRHQHVVLELVQLRDRAVGAHREARAGDVVRDRERDLLAALGVVGRGAALEVGLAAGDRVDAVGRGDRAGRRSRSTSGPGACARLRRRPCTGRARSPRASCWRRSTRTAPTTRGARARCGRCCGCDRAPDAAPHPPRRRRPRRRFGLGLGLRGRRDASSGGERRGERDAQDEARLVGARFTGGAGGAGAREILHGRGLYAAPSSGANAFWRPHHASFA